MSSVHKVTMYVVDIDDSFNENELEILFDRTDWWSRYIKFKSADIGEFEDDHPLNYISCPLEKFESYFAE